MRTRFVEATQNMESGFNWGKFMLGQFDDEFEYVSPIGQGPLVQGQGWGPDHLLVLDLATGEGAMFSPPGSAHSDLNKHKVWVCPMFEPFLAYLYAFVAGGNDPFDLPSVVELPDAPPEMQGYRRTGTHEW